MSDIPPYDYMPPNSSYQERIVSEALAESQAPEDELRMLVPPLSQIMAWPDRFGYPSVAQRTPTIEAVLHTAGLYTDARNEVSGDDGLFSGASRNATGPNPLG